MGIKSIFKYCSLIIFFLTLSCKKGLDKNSDSLSLKNKQVVNLTQTFEGEERIKQFYLSYYEGRLPGNNDLLKTFITKRLFQRIEELNNGDNLVLDYDPFIYGQDYFPEVIRKTLKVKAIPNKINEFEVSFNRFEENETPRKVVLFLVKEKNTYLIDAINSDDLLNLKEIDKFSNEHKITKKEEKQVKNSPQADNINYEIEDYIGSYSYFYDMGKLDEFAAMTIGYSLDIKQNSIRFAGQGYKTNFDDLCEAKMNNGVLEIHYKETIEGNTYNSNKTQPLVKMYKKGNTFYATSSQIKDGKEIKLKEEE